MALAMVAAVASAPAFAQSTEWSREALLDYALTMSCHHVGASGMRVDIVGPVESEASADDAPTTVVTRGELSDESSRSVEIGTGLPDGRTFVVSPGQSVECRFPGGRSAKVRLVMEDSPYLGRCNGDPGTYLSLWIDHRKVESRVPFGGRCRGYDYSPVTYRVDGNGGTRCELPIPGTGVQQSGTEGCVRLPELATLPVDPVEYPVPGESRPQAGTVLTRMDRSGVCAAVRDRLDRDWRSFDPYAQAAEGNDMRIPFGSQRADTLPGGWGFAYGIALVADFDFDNDRTVDRVFINDIGGEGGRYWSPMLIEYGKAATSFRPAGSPLQAVPCQWDPHAPALAQCDDLRPAQQSPGTQREQALPDPAGSTPGTAFFRTRYTTAMPLRHEGRTYVALFGAGVPSRNHVAVIEPLPSRQHRTVCLIERVAPNM